LQNIVTNPGGAPDRNLPRRTWTAPLPPWPPAANDPTPVIPVVPGNTVVLLLEVRDGQARWMAIDLPP
ncbi:MAG: hypothetical protein KDB53_21120, partial [Planctomycetes bacterium]|nr:hypothetical protein [Planctomycetota bacterium]